MKEGKEGLRMGKHIVYLSGGLSSYFTLKLCLEKYGKENVEAVFADTNAECPDLYRFLKDIEKKFDIKITIVKNEKYKDKNPYTLGQEKGRISTYFNGDCSIKLKQQPLNTYTRKKYGLNNKNLTLHFGMTSDEAHRFKNLEKRYKNRYKVRFILAEPGSPFLYKYELQEAFKKEGIELPLQYKNGSKFNNCGGACVKQGSKEWYRLYLTNREKWEYVKKQELKHRKNLLERADLTQEQRDKRHSFCVFIRSKHPGTKRMEAMDKWEKYFKKSPQILDIDPACGIFCGV